MSASPSIHRRHRRAAALLGAAAVLAALLLASDAPEQARAAPCPAPAYGLAAGNLTIAGNAPCDSAAEVFKVRCDAGSVRFDYTVNGLLQGTTNTAVACGAPARLSVLGNGDADTLDLSAVTAGAGFTAISQPNTLDGGYGGDLLIGSGFPDAALGGPDGDILLLRDGVADRADCGAGVDAAQADRAGLDALTACEVADVLPAAPRKCKKKKKGKKSVAAAKKCRRAKGR